MTKPALSLTISLDEETDANILNVTVNGETHQLSFETATGMRNYYRDATIAAYKLIGVNLKAEDFPDYKRGNK